MKHLDLKIALRTFFRNGKWYNFLNIAGLALGLAAFIFVTLYVDNETSYDHWNKNVNRIFLVGREMPNGASPYTPGRLAAAIKSQCPEVEKTGRTNTALFKIPFYTPAGRFLVKKWVGADYSIANILGIQPKGFNLDPHNIQPTVLLSKQTAKVLFPGDSAVQNRIVNMMSRSGMPINIAGVAADAPGNTNLQFDCIGFSEDITQGKDQSYATQIYQTYILVKLGADINLLSKKIDKIYKAGALTDTSQVAKQALAQFKTQAIYLDPLANLHLRPHYGSQVSYQIVKGLSILALIILFVTGINFTNLYISQANKRAKEVGIKKVNGLVKRQIAFQFLFEIFFQCVIALIVSFGIVAIGLPYFNQLLRVNLLISGINPKIIAQLIITLVVLTLLAGVYPAMVMAGFKPAVVLRGDPLTSGRKFSGIRSLITIVQFAFAIGFIITLTVINRQIRYMKTENPGFTAKQVVYIDNLTLYNNPGKFAPVRAMIKAIPGVKNVTVATNVPGGIVPVSKEYSSQGRAYAMNTIGVDYEYFETLNIGLKEGRIFTASFPGDSAGAVINETAVKAMNLKNPIGATIKGRGGYYNVIGVIKDVKAYGFEENTPPVIYVMSDHCGLSKTQIMVQADANAIPGMLRTLGRHWNNINEPDGDNFNYHFLDELYGQLFAKQEQLQSVLLCFSVLAILIAALGLFSQAANAIRLRMKEVAVRKVFGAGAKDLMVTLSRPFFYIVLAANLVAWPLAFIIADNWLETFAYRVQVSAVPFIIALAVSVILVFTTVCLQISRAVRFNPAMKLKE